MTDVFRTAATVAGGCALVLTVPGTMELLLVTLGAMRKPTRPSDVKRTAIRLAVVIPAHDEAALIARCVASVAASADRAGGCTILVVADNCTDDTAALAAHAGARVLIRENLELRGKGYALRTAFEQLVGEGIDAFLVIDADSVVSHGLIGDVRAHLAAGADAVQCRYRVLQPSASLRARLMDVAFLAFNVMRPRGRAAWGLSAGILGNGFALHRDMLRTVPWDAASIVEDLEYHLRLLSHGARVRFIDSATVYGAIPTGDSAARVQRSRWEGGRLRMAREWLPRLAAAIGQGQWRLAEPLIDLLTLPLACHVVLLLLALGLAPSLQPIAGLSLALVVVHVLGACCLGQQPLRTAAALAGAPIYVLWKATTLVAVLAASRRNAGWVRTGRDGEALRPAE